MPTYEYECPRCPRVFEVKQRITEPTLVTCDVCGGPIHRLLSAAPFILKGEGWYVTDYPSESRKKAKESTAKESSGKESSGKESSGKESSGKESSGKESSGKESSGKESAGKDSASKGDGGSAESKPAASSESK